MTAVLKLLFGICLLRNGPESVPTQAWFLVALVGANLALTVFVLGAVPPGLPAGLALNVALIGITTTAALTWFALYVRNLEPRFPATLGAMLGTHLIIAAAMWVGIYIVGADRVGGAAIAFLIWTVVVAGFILHRALGCKLWVGILLALGIRAVGVVITDAALGAAISAAIGVRVG